MNALVTPNGSVSKQTSYLIAAMWVVVVLALWQLSNPQLLPTPTRVLHAFGDLWSRGILTGELMRSFITNLKAIFFSSVISLGLAYLTVLPVFQFPVDFVSKFRFLGLTGLTLPFTLLFGGGSSLRVAILTFAMTAFYVTTMTDVVAQIPQEQFDHARTLRMGPWRRTLEVVVLGNMDAAFDALRANAAIGWAMLTMVEVISQSGGGIGLVLYKANRQFELMPQVFAILAVILLVGWLQDKAIKYFKLVLMPYSDLTLERR